MKVFIKKFADSIKIRARAEGEGVVGDMVEILKPGDGFLGHPYAYWFALPDGEHSID